MDADRLERIIKRVDPRGQPAVEIIKHAQTAGPRLGIFASSFNPPTVAHVELVRRAAEAFALDQVLTLTSSANADKLSYETSLEDRLAMLITALGGEARVSIGLSSHAFYVDLVEAIEHAYPPQTDLHFIVGFDTFERVLDPEDRYTRRYNRSFSGRVEALGHLFARSSFIVASRAGAGIDSVQKLIDREPAVPPDRVLYLGFPADLGELSATEARNRLRAGEAITGLVPAPVEQYIKDHGLYTS